MFRSQCVYTSNDPLRILGPRRANYAGISRRHHSVLRRDLPSPLARKLSAPSIMKPALTGSIRPYICSNCRQYLLHTNRRKFASISRSSPEIYDLATVGGGPVGLALLAALSTYRIVLDDFMESLSLMSNRVFASDISSQSGIDRIPGSFKSTRLGSSAR